MGQKKEISEKFITEKLDPKQGQKRTEIMAYPAKGYDFSLIEISEDKIMGMASASALYLSRLTPDKSAYLTFHRAADMLGASGIIPEYMGINLHVPETVEEDKLAHFWNSLNIESKKFQASITGRSLCTSMESREPYVGGITAVGTTRKVFHVTPEGAVHGDRVLMTKTAGLEATTILSHLFPEYVEEKVGQYNHKLSQKLFFKTSTLQETQEALKFGLGKNGVTSMINVREQGIVGALKQLSKSGRMGLDIDFEKVPVYDEAKEICSLFGLDPYATNSMGSMLLTMPEDVSEDFIKELVGNGIDVVDIGQVNRESDLLKMAGYSNDGTSSGDGLDIYDLVYQNMDKS